MIVIWTKVQQGISQNMKWSEYESGAQEFAVRLNVVHGTESTRSTRTVSNIAGYASLELRDRVWTKI